MDYLEMEEQAYIYARGLEMAQDWQRAKMEKSRRISEIKSNAEQAVLQLGENASDEIKEKIVADYHWLITNHSGEFQKRDEVNELAFILQRLREAEAAERIVKWFQTIQDLWKLKWELSAEQDKVELAGRQWRLIQEAENIVYNIITSLRSAPSWAILKDEASFNQYMKDALAPLPAGLVFKSEWAPVNPPPLPKPKKKGWFSW